MVCVCIYIYIEYYHFGDFLKFGFDMDPCAVEILYKTYTPHKTNMTGWKVPMFNRKYIFIHGGFSSQSCKW